MTRFESSKRGYSTKAMAVQTAVVKTAHAYRSQRMGAGVPCTPALELGLRRSKIQFSIERRYTDNTFHKSLLTMQRPEAQSLFNDVLNLVQVFHAAIGGRTAYAQQPKVVKDIIRGLKDSLILARFGSAGDIQRHLETLEW